MHEHAKQCPDNPKKNPSEDGPPSETLFYAYRRTDTRHGKQSTNQTPNNKPHFQNIPLNLTTRNSHHRINLIALCTSPQP